jgi:[ribosomal protein S5]-alanine N-acetyltransferase
VTWPRTGRSATPRRWRIRLWSTRSRRAPTPKHLTSSRPTIETERLLLRPFGPADAADLARLAGAREVAATTANIPHPYSLADAEGWIASQQAEWDEDRGATFAITLRADGALIGAVGLRSERAHERAELGYWIGVPYWGSGYATEAARAVVEFGFDGLGLNRIFARHMTSNPASGRVMEKIGMHLEGEFRQHELKWGEFRDHRFYGVVRSDR